MATQSAIKPVFLGGSLGEHILFVLSMCRFQHLGLPLCLFHFLTWSVVHIALFAIVFTLFGGVGALIYGVALAAWTILLDVRIGMLFGLMEAGYAMIAMDLLSGSPAATSVTVGKAVGCLVAALAVEVGFHQLLQGHVPGPLPEKAIHVPGPQQPLIGIYLGVVFGLFFLTLDLAMRFWSYRGELHRCVNATASDWHRAAAHEAEAVSKLSMRDWHLRAMATRS